MAVVPFATSGGSGIGGAVSALREAYPDVMWQEGKLLNGMSQEEVSEWIKNR